MTLNALLAQWIDWLQDARKMSPHTVAAYQADLRQFLAFQNEHLGKNISTEDLLNLTVRDFRAWLAHRSSQEYEHRSTSRALSVIRSFFRFLNKMGHPLNAALTTI